MLCPLGRSISHLHTCAGRVGKCGARGAGKRVGVEGSGRVTEIFTIFTQRDRYSAGFLWVGGEGARVHVFGGMQCLLAP